MAKLGDGKGNCALCGIHPHPLSHHAQKPMGRSKGTMRSTSQKLSTPTRLATEQTPEIPSGERSTPTMPATEQAPETPTDADVTMHDPGNASILRCSDSAVEPDTPAERKRPTRHDKDDKEEAVSEIHSLLLLADEPVPVAKATITKRTNSESSAATEQQSKRSRKAESETKRV